MNRTKENEELIHVVNKATDKFKAFPDAKKAYSTLNTRILLDISRSLAVIADALHAEEEDAE